MVSAMHVQLMLRPPLALRRHLRHRLRGLNGDQGFTMANQEQALSIVGGTGEGPVLATGEALSFWGGVDPATGNIIDVHHPLHGACLTGRILLMPSSRGSCTGSGVMLDLILSGRAPAALIFSEAEDVLTLGALVAAEMFAKPLPVIRVTPALFQALARSTAARVTEQAITFGGETIPVAPQRLSSLALSAADEAMLAGAEGEATRQAMRIICAMASQQGATRLIDVTRGHIDGCIYASPANLTFAERFVAMQARVRVPTTMNAISVDRANWQSQAMPQAFGVPAARLADAYVQMGCKPTFTCAPYLLRDAPGKGESIAWSESNAVIFANSVVAARTTKHPDFLDLCIAITARAPESGVYLDEHRRPDTIIDIDMPERVDDCFWPLIGYMAGLRSPDRIPLLCGLARHKPSRDDLKALCAAFGTTSAAPMLHIEGVTPEASMPPRPDAMRQRVTKADMREAWQQLNGGPAEIDLVAIGSPHASADECRDLARELEKALAGRERAQQVAVIVTAGEQVIGDIRSDGTMQRLHSAGVQLYPDICWCSISEPVFPPRTRTVMTNSGKYAHYGPGLSGRKVRFGSLADCVEAAATGRVAPRVPEWLGD